jgi:selenide,water dikinase
LLFDPQTSGGLLVALPRDAALAMARRLRDDGLPGAVIGHVEAGSGVVAG